MKNFIFAVSVLFLSTLPSARAWVASVADQQAELGISQQALQAPDQYTEFQIRYEKMNDTGESPFYLKVRLDVPAGAFIGNATDIGIRHVEVEYIPVYATGGMFESPGQAFEAMAMEFVRDVSLGQKYRARVTWLGYATQSQNTEVSWVPQWVAGLGLRVVGIEYARLNSDASVFSLMPAAARAELGAEILFSKSAAVTFTVSADVQPTVGFIFASDGTHAAATAQGEAAMNLKAKWNQFGLQSQAGVKYYRTANGGASNNNKKTLAPFVRAALSADF